jgi:hypothetical protein
MKIKFSVAYLLSFLVLVFLVQELQDWMHVMVGEWICGCWGTKGFNAWTMCEHSEVSGNILAFVWLAGPLFIYALTWVAWNILESKKSTSSRSIGFSLLFATLPLGRILAAARGASDETNAMRELFQRPDASNHTFVVAAGLIMVLALTIPPLIKAYEVAGGLKERLLIIPLFLFLPLIIDYLFVSVGMNKLLANDVMRDESLPGTPFLVLIWGIICLLIFLVSYRNLLTLFKKSEHTRKKRKSRTPVIETDE